MDAVEKVRNTLVELDIENIQPVVREALDAGTPPQDIALKGLGDGMKEIGALFQAEEYYLADLVLAGETMKDAMEILEPMIAGDAAARKGPVILFTVKGDVHDIGKNLVGTMLTAAGFKVIDLGVDVPANTFVDKIKEVAPEVVGLSGFLTLAFDAMKDTVEAMEEAGLRDKVKIMIGGGAIDSQVLGYVKADAYGKDAMEGVELARQWVGGE